MAVCTQVVKCHCSFAVALDAISYIASLRNGQEAMGKLFGRAGSKVSADAGLLCHIAGDSSPITPDSPVALCR